MRDNFTTLAVDKETAHLVRTYCIFNNLKMHEFVRQVLRERLQQFEEALQQNKSIKV